MSQKGKAKRLRERGRTSPDWNPRKSLLRFVKGEFRGVTTGADHDSSQGCNLVPYSANWKSTAWGHVYAPIYTHAHERETTRSQIDSAN